MDSERYTYTLSELLATLAAPCRVDANNAARDHWRHNLSGNNHDFCGTDNDKQPGETAVDTIERLLRDGWHRGVKMMHKVTADVTVPTPVSIRRRGAWVDAGDEIDMQRVYAGDLDRAWRRTVKRSGQGPQRVRILVDALASAGERASSMRWRGVAALVAADALTQAGYSVQVESAFEGTGRVRYAASCIVKPYASPLDLPALAATTAQPAFFRALWHYWHFAIARVAIRSASYACHAVQAGAFDDGDDGARIFVAHQNISSATDAAAWVRATVEALDSERGGALAA